MASEAGLHPGQFAFAFRPSERLDGAASPLRPRFSRKQIACLPGGNRHNGRRQRNERNIGMATSSITANFCISDAREARSFVDKFVAAAKRRAPLRRHAKFSVLSDPAEIRRFFKSRKAATAR